MNDIRRVIFLDIDGVVWTWHADLEFTPHWLPHPASAANLRALCEETGARIVVNSSWLGGHQKSDIEKTQAFLMRAGLIECLHNDWFTDFPQNMDSEREDAIRRWLATHPPCDWLAVDDVPLNLAPGRALRTDAHQGFTRENYAQSVQMFRTREAAMPHPSVPPERALP